MLIIYVIIKDYFPKVITYWKSICKILINVAPKIDDLFFVKVQVISIPSLLCHYETIIKLFSDNSFIQQHILIFPRCEV